ncbi:MAG TPA: tetratricopeptide repeat protein [Caulobacteraceae bacterium]|jgi:Flp pilus assembly protein TadD|nr:tetratricopeptide repeat protein [Caulobacteraceae bacterium]
MRRLVGGAALALILTAAAAPSLAFNPFGHGKSHAPAPAAAGQAGDAATAVRQALDERRYVDAADLLAKAEVTNVKSAQLTCLRGELFLARGDFPDALAAFRSVAGDPGQRARALEGEGLALSLTGKSDDALAALGEATRLDKSLWRAWNGLGREYDTRRDWKKSQAAYMAALAAPGGDAAIVLNNRGYSHLLQRQTTEAAADFVAALAKDPGLAAARTNLRITLAIEGQYARAAVTGVGDDRAAVLNNVGLAAAIRGDYLEADKLLAEAIEARGQFYARASDNLALAKELEARAGDIPPTPDVKRR